LSHVPILDTEPAFARSIGARPVLTRGFAIFVLQYNSLFHTIGFASGAARIVIVISQVPAR